MVAQSARRDCSIVGATKPEHLDAAIRSLDLTLTDEEVAALEAEYRPHRVRGIDA